ncbi:uncharacterized protein LAESUDRAFT_668947 [Laetiporus sulphureus 93-53]|uniref:Nucleic acid-binding protein n=1 Tax=Laetiporus sulphureus 93-53 TaxID=1314785 RepID=A0A165ICB8_9APHY|nr:uncharacterized protein LAESUDRAFT_668947 [Laetiporus sulphureus 93-53]KZT12884.1 hypothetical protein LAESUDRAFT_668947 [Laetiporus sulphureus 93-53]
MLSHMSRLSALRTSSRAFSTTSRAADLAKLILIGRLGVDPEVRVTKNEKEYIRYVVATTSYPGSTPEGTRPEPKTTWHNVLSFNPTSNAYLRTLRRGYFVYVEANFELREPDPEAPPDTPQGRRQIFLKHESIRVLSRPKNPEESSDENRGP